MPATDIRRRVEIGPETLKHAGECRHGDALRLADAAGGALCLYGGGAAAQSARSIWLGGRSRSATSPRGRICPAARGWRT